jgi:hypothetical protein
MLFKKLPEEYNTETKRYEVSRCGKVRRIIKSSGKTRLTSQYAPCGYMRTKVGNKNHQVHNLVAITFVSKPEDYDATFTVDHIDNNKLNNHATNLRWVSKSKQTLNRRTRTRISNDSMPVIATSIDGSVVYRLESMMDAKKIGADFRLVSKCINGKRKKHAGYTWAPPPIEPDFSGEAWKELSSTQQCIILASNHGRIGYKYNCGYIKKVSSLDKNTARFTEEINTYPRVAINGKNIILHRLIWTTFVGPIPNGMIVNHIDHNKQNAALSNLELITQSQNILAAYDAGRFDGTKTARVPIEIGGVPYTSLEEASQKLGIHRNSIFHRVNNPKFPNYVKA